MTHLFDIDLHWQMGDAPAHAKLQVGTGITALIGPSGVGKTSLVRLIAGLDTPLKGRIQHGDKLLFDTHKGINFPPQKRSIALLAQEPALFPTMTVEANIAITQKIPSADVTALKRAAQIDHLDARRPGKLSGGEARRVALVQALATGPQLLILDEPMTGLDPKLRRSLLSLIRSLSQQTGTPILLITHQIEEMLAVADHAVLMAAGGTLAAGTIEEVLHHPATSSYMGLDDAGRLITATVTGREHGLLTALVGAQTVYLADDGESVGSSLRLRILARDISLAKNSIPDISIMNQLSASISSITPMGHDQLVQLALTSSAQMLNARITCMSAERLGLSVGENIYALIKAVAVKEPA